MVPIGTGNIQTPKYNTERYCNGEDKGREMYSNMETVKHSDNMNNFNLTSKVLW
jgi:hypothetical protein